MLVLREDGSLVRKEGFDTHSERYTKLPVTIRAMQMHCRFKVKTIEGMMEGEAGDWLIEGVEGEFYPCKKSIFEKTYGKTERINFKRD